MTKDKIPTAPNEHKVKDGFLVRMIDMLPEDREVFVGLDHGLGDDGE